MAGGNEGFTAPGLPVQVGPMDVQQKEFRVSRLGGYKMRDVDEFLDDITASLTTLLAENERLRAQAGAAPVVGSPDLDDVSRQADEIIQRARDEAIQILADARAAAVTSAAIAGEPHGGVDAFLMQEREFLQGLAALVQGHADAVKGMARASRSARAAAAEPAAAPAAEATPETGDDTPETAEAREAAAPETPGGATEPSETSPDTSVVEGADEPATPAEPEPEEVLVAEDEDRTIRIEDPQPAAATAQDPEPDGSLRELFWGEED